MRSSIKTLTHISFIGHLSLSEHTCYYDFLDLRFPLLTSLQLGSLFNTTSQERSDTAITRFIIAHPRISHLSLGKFCMDSNTPFQFDGSRLTEGSLPNLRSFEGFPMNITLLAQSNVRSLHKLTTLSLFLNLGDSSLNEMFEAVRLEYSSFPLVQTLRFEFPTPLSHYSMETNTSDLRHRKWVDGFSEICPTVVNWYGTLGPVNQVCSKSHALLCFFLCFGARSICFFFSGSYSERVQCLRVPGNDQPP